jgi:hypothetical protein
MDSKPDNMTDLERRLAALAPANEGLNTDAMLFAAGRASVRPRAGRFVWPALAGLLGLLAIGLGIELTRERGERLVLVQLLRQAEQRQTPASDLAVPADFGPTEAPAADSLVASHRVLENGLESWRPIRIVTSSSDSPAENSTILRAWSRRGSIDQ